MQEFRNIVLGLGIVLPFALSISYFVVRQAGRSNELVAYVLIFGLALIAFLLVITLGRSLKERYLIRGGIADYIIVIISVAFISYKASAPIEMEKPPGLPPYKSKDSLERKGNGARVGPDRALH